MKRHAMGNCFAAKLATPSLNLQHPIASWSKQYAGSPLEFSSAHTEALAILMPLLLCGEQSAQLVFQQQALQFSQQQCADSVLALNEVEADEAWHDEALQMVFSQLPELAEQHKVRRTAQRFYAGLGRSLSLQQQFVRIASLDACVTQLMQLIERGSIGSRHPFSLLCGLIKKDEAKHVYVSKHFARHLGASVSDMAEERLWVLGALMQLLKQQADQFEIIGVDLDKLEKRLEQKWQ